MLRVGVQLGLILRYLGMNGDDWLPPNAIPEVIDCPRLDGLDTFSHCLLTREGRLSEELRQIVATRCGMESLPDTFVLYHSYISVTCGV